LIAILALASCRVRDQADPSEPIANEARVAEIVVSAPSTTISVGETVQLTATPKNSEGNTLTGGEVSWSSDDSDIATVDDSGLVQGVAQGAVKITATMDGVGGSVEISVTSGSPDLSSECASQSPEWIWCDDFESDRLAEYFEYKNPGDDDFIRVAGVGVGDSYGMRIRFDMDQVSAGSLHLAFGRTPGSYFRPVDDGSSDYREIYWRMYLKHAADWTGGGGDKLSRAIVFAGTNWSEAMIAHIWSGNSSRDGQNDSRYYLFLDPASGTDEQGNLQTTKYNDFDNLRWLGKVKGQTPLFDASHVGRWYCVEAHVRLNDAGQSNGVFELWIDDNVEASITDMNWLGSYDDYGINAIFFENYWNSGSPQVQERFFDNIVVSTERIGC